MLKLHLTHQFIYDVPYRFLPGSHNEVVLVGLYRLLFILCTTFIYTICVDTVQDAVTKKS